ncbi:MAG: hypothetical protein JRI23_12235 [Deltaproteobacteria bacterium]|jgi:hypothetical protein|nr:hypothetical protein [Deltaproteobacteria bacterium]MBW2532480.1 hypothetical protein [Deltaproteobacteria bacterium]
MGKKPPLVPVLHRSDSLIVRVAKGRFLSFAVHGKEVEFFTPDRLREVVAVPLEAHPGAAPQAELELRGSFSGVEAYGTHPSVRMVGPVLLQDAYAAVVDLNRRLELPKPIHQVTIAQLEQDPATYADCWVEVDLVWHYGFESSSCGERTSMCLYPPRSTGMTRGGKVRARVVGSFHHTTTPGPATGFGHMGMASSTIRASTMVALEGTLPAASDGGELSPGPPSRTGAGVT